LLSSALFGCAPSLSELAGDKASVCLNLTVATPWGTQLARLSRANCTGCQVQCLPDGSMAVMSMPLMVPPGPTF